MTSWVRQAVFNPLLSYRRARREGQLFFWLICAIAFYTPFEDVITVWLPVPNPVKTLIRLIPEVIIYSILIRICWQRIRSGEGIRKTPIDIPILAIFFSALVSIYTNGSSLPGSIANLRTNWRYLALYYSLVNLDFSNWQLKNFLKNLKTIAIVQAAIALFQLFLPNSIKIAFAGGYCDKAELKGASCGTFLDSAILSGFLIFAAVLVFAGVYTGSEALIPSLRELASTIIIYLGLFASKKRAALFVGLVVPLLILFFLKRQTKLAIALWWSALFISTGFFLLSSIEINPVLGPHADFGSQDYSNFTSYFGTIFTREYWNQTLESSRGWAIVVTVNALIKSGKWWFGLGPELGSVQRGINIFLDPSDQAQLQRNLYVFDDPYWFAVTAYFGVVGLLLYWLVIWQLHRVSRQVIRAAISKEEKTTGTILQVLTAIALVYSFVERLFRLRPFSLYFWLFAGLVVNLYCRQQERRQTSIAPTNMHRLTENGID